MHVRCFTPRSARELLERLRPTAERMCRLYRELESRRPERLLSDQWVPPGYFRRVRMLHASMSCLWRAGVQVKDVRTGLVDFPARRSGRLVLLCWRVGESGLDHWHELDAGFAGRRPLDEDGLWEGDEEAG